MTEIVFMICLLASPATCEERVLPLDALIESPIQCMTQSQPALAAWGRNREEWAIKRWRCRLIGSELEEEHQTRLQTAVQ